MFFPLFQIVCLNATFSCMALRQLEVSKRSKIQSCCLCYQSLGKLWARWTVRSRWWWSVLSHGPCFSLPSDRTFTLPHPGTGYTLCFFFSFTFNKLCLLLLLWKKSILCILPIKIPIIILVHSSLFFSIFSWLSIAWTQ